MLDYPDVPLEPIAEKVGLGGTADDDAVLAVLCANQLQPATVNLLAPLLINSVTRQRGSGVSGGFALHHARVVRAAEAGRRRQRRK